MSKQPYHFPVILDTNPEVAANRFANQMSNFLKRIDEAKRLGDSKRREAEKQGSKA